ncbi:MAG TPA: sulfate reduction electron transfer complex DsrMKJOP subunit DsrJ [Syntrophobacteraceae bacterium]|nr:sulfate reduction electron transfer complex DsrMKJOP subunit DsrJ [Syntrophobacteraceae bacterium]
MKIYDGKYILIGLIIFIVLATFPVWFTHGRTVAPPDLKLDTPVIGKMAVKQCVLPKEEMITGHMKLLNDWRTQVVRNNERMYVASDGKTYEMSLQNECMKCHSNKSEFCDRCHTYAGLEKGVDPYCWNCHIAPKENK